MFLGLLSRGEGDKEPAEDTDTEVEDEPTAEPAGSRVKSGSSSSCSTGLLSPPGPGDQAASSSVQQQPSVSGKSKQESSSGSSKQESSTSACSSWSSIASSRRSTACVTTDL